MKVFCPNCGTDNEGTPGSRVTCRACTASYEVPFEAGATPAPQPSFGGRPVQTFDQPAPVQPPPQMAPAPVQPPPNVWTPNAPGVFVQPPSAVGAPGQTNTLAIVSLVSSLLGCLCGVSSIVGIVTGFMAISQINASGGTQKGRELAIGGVAVGFLSCLMSAVWVAISMAQRH